MTPWTQWLRVDSFICSFAELWDSLLACHCAIVSSLIQQRSQLRWSYGVHLLSKAVPPDETGSTPSSSDEIGPLSGEAEESLRNGDFFGVYSTSQGNNQNPAQISNSQARLQPGFTPRRADTSPHTFRSDALPPSDSDVLAVSPCFGSGGYDVPGPAWSRPPLSFMQRVIRTGRSTWRKVNDFMTPPLWASVLSIVVALNQPLQHVLGVQMRPIRDAIAQAGDCSIPLTLVVLGAYFHHPPEQSKFPPPEANGRQVSLVDNLRRIFSLERWKEDGGTQTRGRNSYEGRTVFVAILARMVVAPALLLPLVVCGRLQGYPHVIRECATSLTICRNKLIPHLVQSLY